MINFLLPLSAQAQEASKQASKQASKKSLFQSRSIVLCMHFIQYRLYPNTTINKG